MGTVSLWQQYPVQPSFAVNSLCLLEHFLSPSNQFYRFPFHLIYNIFSSVFDEFPSDVETSSLPMNDPHFCAFIIHIST